MITNNNNNNNNNLWDRVVFQFGHDYKNNYFNTNSYVEFGDEFGNNSKMPVATH